MPRVPSFIAVVVLALTLATGVYAGESSQSDWAHHARIAAHGLSSTNADEIVRMATESHANAIEVVNDIPGRYESFVNPREKLEALRKVALAVHKVGKHAVVYIAGTE